MSTAFGEAARAVLSSWRTAITWSSIVVPPMVAFNDNIGSIQVVAGRSMAPTLNPESSSLFLDIVWVSRLSDFGKGDVVLLADPVREKKTRIIKRVSQVTHDGSEVFLLGDNSDHSTDSRHFGYVPSVMVEGVVTHVIFTPWRWQSLSK